ncbi:MAG: PH domain-containing protein [Desulfurococcales archaeon]|nr:PH domain-containing protein [Desulfurococcales archaeon]
MKSRQYIYIVTDRRIKTVYKSLFSEVERDIVYTRLSDVVAEKGLLGEMLGFGNVYIISQASPGYRR